MNRRELVEMINQIQNAQLLNHLKEVVSDLLSQTEGFQLNDEHKNILDDRLARHQSGEGKWYSWEEVKERIQNRG